jgi:hypothetical protein
MEIPKIFPFFCKSSTGKLGCCFSFYMENSGKFAVTKRERKFETNPVLKLFGQMRAFVAQLYYCLWLLD